MTVAAAAAAVLLAVPALMARPGVLMRRPPVIPARAAAGESAANHHAWAAGAGTLGRAEGAARAGATAGLSSRRPSPALRERAGMVRIPAGSYLPLYAPMGRVAVAGFALDRYPVTRAEYAAFLAAHPEWRRSRASRALVGAAYLRDWRGDLDFGGAGAARRPVTWVSRPAAAAYCAAAGGRLPTTDEWEYAASASPSRREGAGDSAFQQQLLDLYTRPRLREPGPIGSTFRNAFGVYDLHGLVWEWTDGSPAGASDPAMTAAMHGPAARSGAHDMGCAGSAAGASDTRAFAAFLRYALRAGLTPTTDLGSLGFRCAY